MSRRTISELSGLLTLTKQLDGDIEAVDSGKISLEKRVIATEQSLAEALRARDSLEAARKSLEDKFDSFEALLLPKEPLPFGTSLNSAPKQRSTAVSLFYRLHTASVELLGRNLTAPACTYLVFFFPIPCSSPTLPLNRHG